MAEFVPVAKAGDLAPGEKMCVIVHGKRVALFNVDGTVYAIDDMCSHAEASLSEGEFRGEVVVCPRHGARFNVKTGAALSLPAWAPVATYPVKVEDGEIKVAL
ncbi:MAG: ferredoxin [Firmicutes bacterium]|nr:ferredoxin [Bacillota bacterium]MBO2521541.1 ferredoxin [Bacillota bacterium]